MPYESLLGDLEYFYDELPEGVRRELAFMLVSLSDEHIVDPDHEHDYEAVVRSMFAAQTPIGRLSDLIRLAATFDVYFAMDARGRFATGAVRQGPAWKADRIDAIEAAGRDWARLRSTTFAPAAIAAALSPEAAGTFTRREAPAVGG
jgi:hypothetical protein